MTLMWRFGLVEPPVMRDSMTMVVGPWYDMPK